MTTLQEKFWKKKFGDKYIDRNSYTDLKKLDMFYKNQFGVTRSEMNRIFLNRLRVNSVLEVGCNIGNQLIALQKLGLDNLYGIEINPRAIELAKKHTRGINIINASTFDIPFKDNYFDLVFTSGVLIHIAPKDLRRAMREIYRVSKKYIWGFEYFSPRPRSIIYRGHKNRLWKRDFAGMYLEMFPELKPVKERKFKYLQDENFDQMFILKK